MQMQAKAKPDKQDFTVVREYFTQLFGEEHNRELAILRTALESDYARLIFFQGGPNSGKMTFLRAFPKTVLSYVTSDLIKRNRTPRVEDSTTWLWIQPYVKVIQHWGPTERVDEYAVQHYLSPTDYRPYQEYNAQPKSIIIRVHYHLADTLSLPPNHLPQRLHTTIQFNPIEEDKIDPHFVDTPTFAIIRQTIMDYIHTFGYIWCNPLSYDQDDATDATDAIEDCMPVE